MSPRFAKWILPISLALLAACTADLKTEPEVTLPDTPADPAVLARAFRLDINIETGEVTVVKPGPGGQASGSGPMRSLMGGEVVGMTVSNVYRSPIGQFVPKKRTIKFDLALTNKLSVTDLVTPTFPIPPAGVQGVLAFPYTVAAAGVAGGKATPDTTWNGTGVLPSGSPSNFFNDLASCGSGVSSDCYRWESFGTPLTPGSTSVAHRVGFTVDPGVTTVQAYVVVAADLLDHPPVPPPGKGAVLGVVSSSARGALSGVTVSANPGGASGTTDGAGRYTLTALTAGPTALSLSGLPSGCAQPANLVVTITEGGVSTGDFAVSCTALKGDIVGVVYTFVAGSGTPTPLGGVDVTAGIIGTSTDAAGSYHLSNVPAGMATATLANLPAGCEDPGPQTTTVTDGGVTTLDVPVDCLQFTGTIQGTVSSQIGPTADVGFRAPTLTGVASAVTDALGHYVLADVTLLGFMPQGSLPVGCSNLQIASSGFSAGGLTIDWSLDCTPTTGTISGTVGFATYGTPAGVVVSATVGNVSCVGSVTDVTGAYSVTCPPGIADVVVEGPFPPGCATNGFVQVEVVAGVNYTLGFSFGCYGSISGTVTSPELGPLGGIEVQLLDGQGAVFITTTTGSLGDFGFMNLDAGTYFMSLTGLPIGCVAAQSQALMVTVGLNLVADFTVDCSGAPPGPLTGSVISPEDGPMQAATVELLDGNGDRVAETTTDNSGAFDFGTQSIGTYFVSIAGLPHNCANPGPQTVIVLPAVGAVALISVTCS
ncbi:MAG: carboxypeptidase-like regulatory domain-containing protein [Gemmatimonadota bacterium]